LAAREDLNDDHGAAAFRARPMGIKIGGVVTFSLDRPLVRFRFCIE
jgi:hypothetical protein